MRISLDWLGDYVTWIERDPNVIADTLTLRSAEVEGIERQGALLGKCCVGKILKIMPHANASKLQLADVQTDDGTKRVVCGGTNLYEGMLVAFAHVGATVRHGEEMMTLSEAVIRGEKSAGMLCAAEELDLTEVFPSKPEEGERPIIDLTPLALKPGTELRTALGLTDVVLDINNTAITNRPDLFSHLGFARECVAIGIAKWKKEPNFKMPKFPKQKLPFAIKVEAKNAVYRYFSCLIEIDSIGETPEWMKRRLIATGFRPLSLPVDITNYVSHDVGMPLHSFDADDIKGDVHFRLTEEGETIRTLDEVDRKLPAGALVLSDDIGVFDLMGIMGGLRSSTKESTKRIYLHSAAIDPVVIRRTTSAIGHRTDASTIYEKGVPTVTAEWGFIRALALMLELVPGARLVSAADQFGKEQPIRSISLNLEKLKSVLGVEIPAKEVVKRLTSLGASVRSGKTALTVTPPPWRTKDLLIEEDLIDEIARTGGYHAIPDLLPLAPIQAPARDERTPRTRHLLQADGFMEILPLSLIGEHLLRNAGMDSGSARRLESPLSADLALLQPSTLPGLLEHAKRSMEQVENELRTFRIATVFSLKEEHRELGLLVAKRTPSSLADEPVLRVREILTATLEALGYDVSVEQKNADSAWMHPGRTARISVTGADGKPTDVGTIAEIHPDTAQHFDLPHRAAAALIDWSLLLTIAPIQARSHGLPTFPAVIYDTTVARKHDQPVGPLLSTLKQSHPLLEDIRVQDLYQNPREDHYRLTLRCTYRSPDRTLTEEEAKKAHEDVMTKGNLKPIA